MSLSDDGCRVLKRIFRILAAFGLLSALESQTSAKNATLFKSNSII
jgi:hypothetical protein